MDPYQILGISRNATPEEIKKAYRQKAKQYHPDLHPDDPSCTEKMNEINEAYDRLTHPEKYKDTIYGSPNGAGSYQNQQNGYGAYQNRYGNYQNGQNGYGNYQNGQNGQGSYQNGQNGNGNYQNQQNNQNNGYGGYWDSGSYQNFGDFWFGTMGGFNRTMERPKPQALNRDSQDIINSIYYINQGQYDQAIQILNNVVSTLRDDRWNYLSAIANYERGQKIIAMDQIQKAMQLAPYNQEYKQAYNYMNQVNVNYQNSGSSYNSVFSSMGNICLYYMLCQCFCLFCH